MQSDLKYSFKLPSFKYILLLGVFPLFFLLISKAIYIQGQTISVFLGCFIFLIENKYESNNRGFDFFEFSLKYLFFSGTLIGALFVIFNYNDLFKFLQYSFLSAFFLVSYKFGKQVPKEKFLDFVLLLFTSEVFLFLGLFIKGFESRTSIGASNLFPLALILLINRKFISKKTFLLVVFGLMLYILVVITSGMRSVVGVTIFSTLLVSLRFFLFDMRKLLRIILIGGIVLIAISYLLPQNIINVITSRVGSVKERFEYTIFSDEGVKYDSDDTAGRKLEAKSAIEEFMQRDITITYFLGYGNGYYYYDKMQQREKTHMHITYYAFFTRYGLIGMVIYFSMFFIVTLNLIKVFFKKGFEYDILFGLSLSVFQVFFISLFAASLTFLINWIILGFMKNNKR